MSVKERRRMSVLSRVLAGDLSLMSAAEQMEVSYRQAKRLWARFRRDGDAGLVHGLRGQTGNRRGDQAVREQALKLYQERYSDFGLTLACEYLLREHKLKVDDQSLRRWLQEAQLWQRRRKSPRRHRRRERRACLGELVQIDGSHHDWFEGRGPWCVLMVMVDDATNRTWARFCESESTVSAMKVFRSWCQRWGLPLGLYSDQHSIYRANGEAADEVEKRTGKRPTTQFGRAMQELGVTMRCAKTPQAKGRVERMNGVLQDRLVKALRLAGISDMASANRYLEEEFLPQFNQRFERPAAGAGDAHRQVTSAQLEQALCEMDQRVVGKDHCVSLGGRVLQLEPGKLPSLANKRVLVRQLLDGSLQVKWRDHQVEHRELPARPVAVESKPTLAERVMRHQGIYKPPRQHPWRGRAPGQAIAAC